MLFFHHSSYLTIVQLLPDDLEKYVQTHTSAESPLLHQIHRETYMQVLYPIMLSGPVQGQFLKMQSIMMRPKNILEIGTFTGYSTLCLVEGLQEGGKLYTIDINEELETRVRGYFEAAGHADKIDFRIGDALEIIPTIDATFDLVFLDADKINYSNYYDLVFDKLSKNGIILADNVLWDGKVVQSPPHDEDTEALIEFSKMVQNDKRVENVLLPIRDGVMMIRKL